MKNTDSFLKQKLISLRDSSASTTSALVKSMRNSRIAIIVSDKLFFLRNRSAIAEPYFIEKNGSFEKKAKYAVILHLYHTESWDNIFEKKLTLLAKSVKFDLYVTIPVHNAEYGQIVRKVFPDANLLVVPNKGRDVLPFIKTALLLRGMGYKKALKVHSKKSTHRDSSNHTAEDGGSWLRNTIDSLIPDDQKAMDALTRKLNDDLTGMIGVLSYYYPLRMYFGNNHILIKRIVSVINGRHYSDIIFSKIDKLGFFGGTMFWVDLEALGDVLGISKHNFQSENGQTDGTTAHALERIFCVLPQIDGKKVFGASKNKIVELKDGDAQYADWYYNDVAAGRPHVSIVVPVYADWSSLSKNVESLRKSVGNCDYISVHYLNDCGPEADSLELKITQNIRGLTNFYYHRNEKNLGFVKNCNRAALEVVDQRDDVLLLNSDTKVTSNFVFAMRKALYSKPSIGAVTSRSNNATIWSIPMTSKLANHRLLSYLVYRVIKKKLPEMYITPTIHGFCALIRREVIHKYGLFDEVYGKGYGEENDFAMRIRRHGWQSAVANESFVFHYESRSFGNEVRNRQIENNEKILTKRYPEYRQLVQEYWDSVKEPLK